MSSADICERREGINRPVWFNEATWLHHSEGLKVAVCESQGQNALDLMLAVYLATRNYGVLLNVDVYDDKRDAHAAATLAKRLAQNGVQVVVGHFAATAAMSAVRTYDKYEILFLAPGCSDPDLCSRGGPGKHAVKFFGTDEEQIESLLSAIPLASRTYIFAQRGNYGHRLGRTLHQRLSENAASASIEYSYISDGRRPRVIDSDCIVIAGSCEFAKYVGSQIIFESHQTLLLSDDSRLDVAAEFKGPSAVFVAGLECRFDSAITAHYGEILQCAALIGGHPPGPYFLTSYLACQALCKALQESPHANPDLLRKKILLQKITSPYGLLSFTETGALQGHRWILMSPVKSGFSIDAGEGRDAANI